MAELQTRATNESVEAFLDGISDRKRRQDCRALVDLMRKATGSEPKMWCPGIVGFGDYHYKYASGREGDWFLTGFSPRKGALTLYIMAGFERYESLMERLGKYKTGKSCLYVKRLEDVDIQVLRELVRESVVRMKQLHGA